MSHNQKGAFGRPLSLPLVYDRVLPSRDSAAALVVAMFLLAYALDEVIAIIYGLDQLVVASFVAATGLTIVIVLSVKDLFLQWWRFFRLHDGEFIIGLNDQTKVVIADSNDKLQQGVLRKRSKAVLIHSRPWHNRRVSLFLRGVSVVFEVSLEVSKDDPWKVLAWADYDEESLISDIRSAAQRVDTRNHSQTPLNDMVKLVATELNGFRYLGEKGVTITIALCDLESKQEIGATR